MKSMKPVLFREPSASWGGIRHVDLLPLGARVHLPPLTDRAERRLRLMDIPVDVRSKLIATGRQLGRRDDIGDALLYALTHGTGIYRSPPIEAPNAQESR